MRGGTVGGKFQDWTATFNIASLDPKRQTSSKEIVWQKDERGNSMTKGWEEKRK